MSGDKIEKKDKKRKVIETDVADEDVQMEDVKVCTDSILRPQYWLS